MQWKPPGCHWACVGSVKQTPRDTVALDVPDPGKETAGQPNAKCIHEFSIVSVAFVLFH